MRVMIKVTNTDALGVLGPLNLFVAGHHSRYFLLFIHVFPLLPQFLPKSSLHSSLYARYFYPWILFFFKSSVKVWPSCEQGSPPEPEAIPLFPFTHILSLQLTHTQAQSPTQRPLQVSNTVNTDISGPVMHWHRLADASLTRVITKSHKRDCMLKWTLDAFTHTR